MTRERSPDPEVLVSLHDSELVAIEMDRAARRIVLVFREPLGMTVELVSDAVMAYRIDNVRHLNVASRVRSSASTTIAEDELLHLSRWACSSSTGTLLLDAEVFAATVLRLKSHELLVLHLDPTWGAEACIIAQSLSVHYGFRRDP